MSIKLKIHITLGIVLALHIFTAIMGHTGLQKSQVDFVTYEDINAETIRVLAIDKSIAELQRNVSTYMLSGHESAADRVRELLIEINDAIDVAIESADRASVVDQFKEMASRTASFGRGFEKVVTDRAVREQLVHEQMFPIREGIFEQIDTISLSGLTPLEQVKDRLYRAENAALRYLEQPNFQSVNEAKVQIDEAEMLLAQPGDSRSETAVLVDEIKRYELAFLQAVQATQGYMHLVNVVLAGEAGELLYLSREIRVASLLERQSIKDSMQAGAERFLIWSDFIALLTVLAGLLTAGLMTRAVVGPILSITDTLKMLSMGQSDETINYTSRTDEIGEMANAAEIFRQKNHETEELLISSQKMSKDLTRRNNQMSQFVYTVSHDLKSPLVTIQGFAGALAQAYSNNETQSILSMIERINNASIRMSRTLDDLLELSRIGEMSNNQELVNFAQIVDDVLCDLDGAITSSKAQIKIDAQGDLVVDKNRLQQVLQNLIQNAITHAPSQDGIPRIRVAMEHKGNQAVISVQDEGGGIDDQFKDKIFGLFQRLSNKTPGTGVGLAIVQRVADGHGGIAWLDTAYQNGARFCISIPQSQQPSQIESPVQPKAA